MIVAINKMDKPDARPERVRTELLQHEVQVELLGGDVARCRGVGHQEDQPRPAVWRRIGLQAEILDLKRQSGPSEPKAGDRGQARSVAVARWRPCWCSAARSHPGDIVVAGAEWGRVRALISDTGEGVENRRPVGAGRGSWL